MFKIKPAAAGAAAAAAAAAVPVIVAPGFGIGPAAGKAVPVVLQPVVTPPASSMVPAGKGAVVIGAPISIVDEWDPGAAPVFNLDWGLPEASAAKSKSPSVAAAAVGVELLSKKRKKSKQDHELLQALRVMQKKDKIIAKYNKLRMEGKRKEAIEYAERHGMIDEIFDTSQYSIKGDGLSAAAAASIKSKSSSSKKSSKAGEAAAAASESPLEIVEITPPARSPSLSPIIPKQASLSFGQKAEMLEKENLKSNPHDRELPLEWRQELARHSKRLNDDVSPTFKPRSGRWM
jgi:hypothetical protein